jgi:hypothetical protein
MTKYGILGLYYDEIEATRYTPKTAVVASGKCYGENQTRQKNADVETTNGYE